MPISRFCKSCHGWHDLEKPWPEACAYTVTPTYRTHGVISDSMKPCRHPVTGRITDSKSVFRRDTKASGCIEVGNDTSHMRFKPERKKSESRKKLLHSLLADKSDRQVQQLVKQEIKARHV